MLPNLKEACKNFNTQDPRSSAGIPHVRLMSSQDNSTENLPEFSREVWEMSFGNCSVHMFQDLVINRSHLFPQSAVLHPNLLSQYKKIKMDSMVKKGQQCWPGEIFCEEPIFQLRPKG